jgi:hypothetical protein
MALNKPLSGTASSCDILIHYKTQLRNAIYGHSSAPHKPYADIVDIITADFVLTNFCVIHCGVQPCSEYCIMEYSLIAL